MPISLKRILPLLGLLLMAVTEPWAAPAPRASGTTNAVTSFAKQGAVQCSINADSALIQLDRDLLVTIEIQAPHDFKVQPPSLSGRLQGFNINGAFDPEPEPHPDFIIHKYCFRLTPGLAEEYRIAPLPIIYVDYAQQPPQTNWFPSKALAFKLAPIIEGQPSRTFADIAGPLHIWPPFKTIARWIGMVVLALAILAGLWWGIRKMRRAIKLRRMSPKERALLELAELLARDLPGQQQFKTFYLAITLIVRRYIERAHAIRAPEQTTQEFLASIVGDSRFSAEVVRKLRAFLQTADLVKFAAFKPDAPAVEQTVSTARDYIETDEYEQKQRGSLSNV